MKARAFAHTNIALIKYWGKAPKRNPLEANLPAVPSLSLTLDALWTETEIRFDPQAASDHGTLNGEAMSEASLLRCRPVLARVRQLADVQSPFVITSHNHVPTAAGLASSGFGAAGGAFEASVMTLGFFAGGAMVCWPLAAALSRDFFLNVFGLNETSVK